MSALVDRPELPDRLEVLPEASGAFRGDEDVTRPGARGGVWASKQELVEQIMYYIKRYNEDAVPFSWNYTGKPLKV